MNESIIKGKWQEIKGEIQRKWGKVTGDELDRTEGNMKSVAGIIRRKYGIKEEEISSRLDELVSKYRRDTADKAGEAGDRRKEKFKQH